MSDPSSASFMTALIDEHYQLIYRYVYRLCGNQPDAEDLTQQTFLAAQRNLGQLRSPDAARAWLCTIARHAFLQSQRRPQPLLSLPEKIPAKEVETPPGDIDSDELQRALQTLPEEFRTPLILFYLQDLSYKEISAVQGIPLGTVMSRISRGKTFLRQRLAADTQLPMSVDCTDSQRPPN